MADLDKKLFERCFETLEDGREVFYPLSRECISRPYLVPNREIKEFLRNRVVIFFIFLVMVPLTLGNFFALILQYLGIVLSISKDFQNTGDYNILFNLAFMFGSAVLGYYFILGIPLAKLQRLGEKRLFLERLESSIARHSMKLYIFLLPFLLLCSSVYRY